LIVDDTFLLFYNAHYEPLNFTFPPEAWGKQWVKVLDTQPSTLEAKPSRRYKPKEKVRVEARAIAVFCSPLKRK
jgi:isoamylase